MKNKNITIIARAIREQLRKSIEQSVLMPVTVMNSLPMTFSTGTEMISPITVPTRSANKYWMI